MTEFTPIAGLIGGLLIGFSAFLLMALLGRIAGISGIVGGLFDADSPGRSWRLAFILGLVLGPLLYMLVLGRQIPFSITGEIVTLVLGGLLVGYGTRLGAGCTSGHGICGIGRGSPRSMVSVAIFMGVAAVTVYICRHVVGA